MKHGYKHPFKTEAELCAAFQDWAEKNGWTVYPETAGHDLLLVDKDDHQMAVEAKLKLNLKLLSQILPSSWDWNHIGIRERRGATYRAILLPERPEFLEDMLAYIGVEVFYPVWKYWNQELGKPSGFASGERWGASKTMWDWNPEQQFELPEYRSTHTAGCPAPVSLTPWKIGALKVLARLELDGEIKRSTIASFGIDPRRWCCSAMGWLVPMGDGIWKRGKHLPAFDKQHPDVYAQILAEQKELTATGGRVVS